MNHDEKRPTLGGPAESQRSSRARYFAFRKTYRAGRLEGAPAARSSEPAAAETEESRSADKAGNRKYLRQYLRWLWPYRVAIAVLFLLALTRAGLEMIEPLFMRYIIDRVLLNTTLSAATRVDHLHLAGLVFVAVLIVSNLIGVLKDYRQRLLNTRLMLALRRALFDRMLHLPLPTLWNMKTGGILSRITGDVDTTTGLMHMAVISPALSAFRLIIAIGVLVNLNWRLAAMALAVIPGIMFVSLTAARRIRPIYRSLRNDVEHIDGRVGEIFSGIRVVRAFGREARELLFYMVGRHAVLRKEMFAYRREMLISLSWSLLLAAVNVVIVWYGGYLYIRGGASIGDLMAFQWYTFLLLAPVWNLVNTFSELQRSLAAVERVFEVLAMPADKPDKPNAIPAPKIVHELTFEQVEFEYREGKPVVRDVSVSVPGGSVVALVGRSGAGKTTMTDLVARFHDPTRGRILLNGTDIRDLKLQSYRELLAIVQQDVFLFDGSVRDNIAYGRHEASDAEIRDAAERANAHEFIVRMPDQYGTFIGERGVKLSGGQQQRLAIARAILAKPQILILDEATSNLDTESEQMIQASMSALLAGRTTFVIAHRLSTIRRADMILLMQDGDIIERGTHDALMTSRGVYHDMVQRQVESHSDAADELIRS